MPERRLHFEGAVNFRDLGGYATRDGGQTRWGRVYRSDGLHALTDGDLARFGELGIRTVFDLRRDSERESLPNRVPSTPLCIVTPVEQAGVTPIDRASLVDAQGGEELLRAMYANMLAHSGAVIGRIFTDLADAGRVPAVFHCHAGKDRTGLVAALLLEALGVERELVLDDYELTAQSGIRQHLGTTVERLVEGGMAAEAAAGLLGAPRWAMAETLADLDAAYGGAGAYLASRAGVDAASLARLRAALTER